MPVLFTMRERERDVLIYSKMLLCVRASVQHSLQGEHRYCIFNTSLYLIVYSSGVEPLCGVREEHKKHLPHQQNITVVFVFKHTKQILFTIRSVSIQTNTYNLIVCWHQVL